MVSHWKWLLLLILPTTEQSYLYSGRPLPRSDLLDEVLSKFMNKTDYTGSLFNFLKGDGYSGDPDNLDVGILDADNVFKIIANTKKRYQGWFRRTRDEAIEQNPVIVEKALDFMKQSIYGTRYRMKETERFRKKYSANIRYNIAIFYGALMQISLKIETLYTIMKKLPLNTHFIWFVIIYEKILAGHVDTYQMVERIFDLDDKQKRLNAGYKVVIAPTLPALTTKSGRKGRATPKKFTTQQMMQMPDDDSNYTYDFGKLPGMYDDDIPRARKPVETRAQPVVVTSENNNKDDNPHDNLDDDSSEDSSEDKPNKKPDDHPDENPDDKSDNSPDKNADANQDDKQDDNRDENPVDNPNHNLHDDAATHERLGKTMPVSEDEAHEQTTAMKF